MFFLLLLLLLLLLIMNGVYEPSVVEVAAFDFREKVDSFTNFMQTFPDYRSNLQHFL